MNDLVNSIFSMRLDLYIQEDFQDENTGAIKKSWIYYKTVPCFAKGIITNTASTGSGDRQTFSAKYSDRQTLEIRTEHKLNYRQKITNIVDPSGKPIWVELDYPSDTPTVFEVASSTPITDPFGSLIAYNSIVKRSESQIIGD